MMTQKLRRTTLKSLALTLPAAWIAPIVQSVVLPAHAQTSACSAPRGCYQYDSTNSFHWPGGAGKATVTYYINSTDCGNETTPTSAGTDSVAVAASTEEASALLGCDAVAIRSIPTVPELTGGCRFFGCATG